MAPPRKLGIAMMLSVPVISSNPPSISLWIPSTASSSPLTVHLTALKRSATGSSPPHSSSSSFCGSRSSNRSSTAGWMASMAAMAAVAFGPSGAEV